MRDSSMMPPGSSPTNTTGGDGGGSDPTPAAIALRCMQEADWEIDTARKRFHELLAEGGDLLGQVLRIGVDAVFSSVASVQRSSLCHQVGAGTDDTSALLRAAKKDYLESYLVLGKKLGDCSPADLRKNIAMRAAREKTEAERRSFETAVLKKLKPSTKRVRDDLSPDDVRRIAKKVLS